MSRRFRIAAHSLVLAVANICAVLAGFVAYVLARPANQIALQLPVAVGVSLVLFAVWSLVTQRGAWQGLRIERPIEGVWIYLAAFVWGWVLFVPVHFVTQGFLTSWGNLGMLSMFQAVVNVVVVLTGLAIAGRAPDVRDETD